MYKRQVSGCLEFDPSTVDCLKCDQENYYLDSGSCGARDKSLNISYCEKLNENNDNCNLCLPSFQITDDKLKCLPHIPHCATYVSSSIITHSDYTNENTLILKCDTCDDYFYISPNNLECIPQDSPGCVTFTPNANTCMTCASGYFLDNDQCILYTEDFCETYQPTSDACATCFDGFFLSGSSCVKYSARNCLTFDSTTDNCATCLNQYYLSTDAGTSQKNCLPFTARNCKSFTNAGTPTVIDSCDSCYQGYVLSNSECCLLYTSPSPRD